MGRRISQEKRMSLAPSLIMAPMEDTNSERKSPIREFLNSHIKTIVTIFMIFGTIAVIVVIVMVHKWRWESQLEAQAHACLDVAIVGGGLSGAYTAWRLRQRGLKVGLYEATDRIGGRFYTQRFEGIPPLHAELGASLFLPQEHSLLNQTIHALKLTPQLVRPPSPDPNIFYLRGTRLPHRDLNTTKIPYNLRQEEQKKYPDELKKLYFKKATVNSSRAYNNLLKVMANDGEPLYMHGYWNLLGNFASREGYNFLYDTAPYRSLLSNANAAVLSKIFLDDLEGKTMTVKEGMDAIPKLLVEEFLNASKKHTKKMNHKLECVHEGDHGYTLSFWITRTTLHKTFNTYEQEEVCARNVVLALPKFALESLNWGPSNVPINRIYQYLQTVEDVPSLRVIFVYNQTWWNHRHEHMGHVITDLPIRQVRYLGSQLVQGPLSHSPAEEKHIFLAASPDSTDVDYFSDLSEQFKAGKKSPTTSKIILDISRQIAKVYDIKEDDMPEPETVLVQDWSASLSGAGWHLWKKGVNYEKVVRRVMQPSRRDSIYIVGSTYCGGVCQLWAEGALNTVEELLRTHLSPIDIRRR